MNAAAPHIQSLKDSMRPLEAFYNENTETSRFLAILSPTCPGCLSGANAIRHALKAAQGSLTVGIVWIPMLADDTQLAIEQAAAEFTDSEVTHFADPNRLAGRKIAASLGAKDDIAWDVYLFYDSDTHWVNGPPEPGEWVHQLAPSPWTPPERYRCGTDLTSALTQSMHRIIDEP